MGRPTGSLNKKRADFRTEYGKVFKGPDQQVLTRLNVILNQQDLKRADELQILMWLGNKLWANPKALDDDDDGGGGGNITIINQMPDADSQTIQAASNTVRLATGAAQVQRIGASSSVRENSAGDKQPD